MTLTEGRPAATAGTAYEVALADSDGVQVGAQQLNLSLEGDSWSVARFDGLADGSYTLSVRAPGIAPYSQKIDVKGDSSAVELYVGDLAADPQAPARIGVLVPGDVNGDGTVDDADASAIIDDIEAASPACDANGDGTVSLADLETAVSSFDRVAVEATVARSLPPAAVEAAPGEGTEVASGSLDEVVGADAKPVSLRASEAISDEHPVEVSFDLAKDSEQAPKLGGMVINVPASGDHASEAGRLLVELTDGTVREIGLNHTKLETFDGQIVFLPNKELSASRIVNFTALGKRRVVRTVTASYDAPTEDVKAACREALAQVANDLIDPAPEVYLTNYGSSSIEYTVRCWTKPEDYAATDLALNEALRVAFEHHGVEMTYDHLNVHMVDR